MKELTLEAWVEEHEGLRFVAYDDATGKDVLDGGVCKGTLTIGYGQTGDAYVWPGRVITEQQAKDMLHPALARASGAAAQDVGITTWQRLDGVRRIAVADMAYNLGGAGLAGFGATIALIRAFDWPAVHKHLLASLWARQVGSRANDDAHMLLTGLPPDGWFVGDGTKL